MNKANYITEAIEIAGLQPVAKAVGKSYQAVKKWELAGCLPRTEWTGETSYAKKISKATGGKITASQLKKQRPTKAA